MAKKASLFSGGSKSVSATYATENPTLIVPPSINVSIEALLTRNKERKTLPQHPLKFIRIGINVKIKLQTEYDFDYLVVKFPHHRVIINQLLVGISSNIVDGISYQVIRNAYNSLEPFICFLNDDANLNSTNVKCIANIDAFPFVG